MQHIFKTFFANLLDLDLTYRDNLTNDQVLNEINQALPRKYIIIETKKVLHHYVVNNNQAGAADFCNQCGLYFTDPIHIRGQRLTF